jgi:phosphate transport system permease protein
MSDAKRQEPAFDSSADFAATPVTRQRVRREKLAKYVTLGMALVLVLPVCLIVAYVFIEAAPVLSLSYLWENPADGSRAGGIWAPLIGTFYLVLVSLMIVAPIGILAGIYLNEYAKDNWFTRIVNMAVTSLAGVPSIVHALFGVGAFVLFFRMGACLLAASCTVAVMTLPVIITATREALNAVPVAFREACWNMGASRWQTIRTIVLPNSVSGILTGVILEIARAAGETAPILFTGAVYFSDVADSGVDKLIPYYLGDKFMALSMHLHVISTQITDMPREMQFGTAAVIIGLVFVVNSVSVALRVYLRSRKRW